ncbi:hypothetical protein B4916_22630 [Yersinia intermedia]|nr:hypothetical protein B4916_22630 [Yersinia intermedia]
MTAVLSRGDKYSGIRADLTMPLTYAVILISLLTAKSMDILNAMINMLLTGLNACYYTVA